MTRATRRNIGSARTASVEQTRTSIARFESETIGALTNRWRGAWLREASTLGAIAVSCSKSNARCRSVLTAPSVRTRKKRADFRYHIGPVLPPATALRGKPARPENRYPHPPAQPIRGSESCQRLRDTGPVSYPLVVRFIRSNYETARAILARCLEVTVAPLRPILFNVARRAALCRML